MDISTLVNCHHCFSTADTWFDRSCAHDANGKSLPYEEFPFRCSDCGRNVDAPRSYYGLPEIRYVDFDVRMPGTVADPETGLATDSRYVKTIKVPVYGEGEEGTFLTSLAHLLIDEVKLREYFSSLPNVETYMGTPNPELDGLTPNEAMSTHDGQRALICLAYKLGLYTTQYPPRRSSQPLSKP